MSRKARKSLGYSHLKTLFQSYCHLPLNYSPKGSQRVSPNVLCTWRFFHAFSQIRFSTATLLITNPRFSYSLSRSPTHVNCSEIFSSSKKPSLSLSPFFKRLLKVSSWYCATLSTFYLSSSIVAHLASGILLRWKRPPQKTTKL